MKSILYLLLLTSLFSCALDQEYSKSSHNADSLTLTTLSANGVALISPTTITGHEEDTQALALTFATTFADNNPQIPLVKLSQTLSLLNEQNLSDNYKHMYDIYRDTGILQKATLKQIGMATNARFIVLLKLSQFNQDSKSRFSFLGLRVLQTNKTNIRLFMQIWDSENGRISYEASEELTQAHDSSSSKPITFEEIVATAATNLLKGIP